jgi:hypothetical protein
MSNEGDCGGSVSHKILESGCVWREDKRIGPLFVLDSYVNLEEKHM